MQAVFKYVIIAAVIYLAVCILVYCFQEKLIFFPDKTDASFQFNFPQPFEEVALKAKDGCLLHGVLFKTTQSKGLVFYLHGNAGSVESWGSAADTYTSLGFDVFMLDYRGYGKSAGSINNEQQFLSDVQLAYDTMKHRYTEEKIVVLGYSIGTGAAAFTAASNHPRLLILQAPYFNLKDMMRTHYAFLPTFLLKYPFYTNEYITRCNMPIVLIHGDADEVIPYQSSQRLKALTKSEGTLITLKGQGHNGITDNPEYLRAITAILK